MRFEKINVNPKGRKTGDCSTRAIAGTLNISWEEALQLQFEESMKSCYGITNKEVTEAVLARFGYVKMKEPRKWNNKRYNVNEMDQILTEKQMQEGVLVAIAGHDTCIKNGVIQDLWDCGRKSVRNYYVLGE